MKSRSVSINEFNKWINCEFEFAIWQPHLIYRLPDWLEDNATEEYFIGHYGICFKSEDDLVACKLAFL